MSSGIKPAVAERATRDALVARLAVLEAEARQVRQALRDDDDGRWVRVLAISVGGCVFTAADLISRAVLDPDLAAALASRSPKQLGKRLARCVDRDLDGLTVQRVLETADGWVWTIALQPGR
jgi:hypothetical protein